MLDVGRAHKEEKFCSLDAFTDEALFGRHLFRLAVLAHIFVVASFNKIIFVVDCFHFAYRSKFALRSRTCCLVGDENPSGVIHS